MASNATTSKVDKVVGNKVYPSKSPFVDKFGVYTRLESAGHQDPDGILTKASTTEPITEWKASYIELPPEDDEFYPKLFQCSQCKSLAIPTASKSILCNKGHIYCVGCRQDGDFCNGPRDSTHRKRCSGIIDRALVDPFALRVFKACEFPCPNRARGCTKRVIGRELLAATGPVFNCKLLH